MGDETRGAIGVFWDIENCNVPRFASALCMVQRVRERFFTGLREAEFMCVCDINKESKAVIEDLNNGQVNVVHINATSKNAADDKIRQSLRRFADTHPPDTKVVLISSDVNFATDLSDLRHRKHMYIILIHGKHVHEALIACAREHYYFDELFADLPLKAPSKCFQNLELVVRGYPPDANLDLVKKCLRHLSYNCGGRVGQISEEKAVVIFSSPELLHRAKKRMEGEDVLGGKIITSLAIEEKSTSHQVLSPPKYHRNRSPVTPHGGDGRQDSPAPGAPRDTLANKHQSSSSSGWSTSFPQNRSYTDLSTRASTTHQPEADFINYVCDMVQFKPPSPSAPADSVNEEQHPQRSPLPHKEGKMSRNMLMIQQQHYQEQQESQHSVAVRSPVPPSQPSATGLPAKFSGPLVPTPPGFDGGMPLHGVENGGVGTLNISKTVNFTYHSSYVPHIHTPHAMYPYQQYGGNFQQNVFTPVPRPRPQMRYIDRSHLRNNNLMQGKNGNARAILSSTPDVFGDEDDDGQESTYSRDSGQDSGPVDLYVSNLDYNISSREWRKILASTFQPHVQVLGIFVRTQPDNTSLAVVKVPSLEEARFAISQFHRRKIGYKRIHVSLRNDSDQAPAENTRQEAVSILSDTKDYMMPVFKFIELYEKRHHKTVSVSDLYKMKDIVEIIDRGGTGRMVRLSAGVCPTPTLQSDSVSENSQEEMQIQAVCPIHCPEGSTQHAEALNTTMLPNVRLQRRHFAAHVHSLLLSHNGMMPLMSFPVCYSAEFTVLPVCHDGGVPLEHLLSCVPGVEIKVSHIGNKVIHFQENKEPLGTELCGRASPMLSQQLSQISREIGDVLRQSSHCMLPASKFIPSYHHHFGRQCRVADYGYTKLAELFDSLPHVLQVLGTGDRKVLTLSHRAQVKRFIADMLKMLKSQPGKQVSTDELPKCYERVLGRQFDITHYGMAFLEDLFMDIPPTSILITLEGNKTIMAIPKRDQTPEEVERTKQFALEVVDLLKHNPMCRMAFNKFVPAYHHHFGRQCRVADYGFTKLTDLFECISQVVEILEDQEERMLKLTAPEMRAVLSEQIVGLLQDRTGQCLPVSQLLLVFQRQYGFPLCLVDYGSNSVVALLGKIKHCVSVETRDGTDYVVLHQQQEIPKLAQQLIQLLMDQSGGCLPLVELCSRYHSAFGVELDVQKVQEELSEYVQVSSESDDGSALIRLTALQTLGRDIRTMLRKTGSIPLPSFMQTYLEHFSVELKPALYGFLDAQSLLRALPHIINLTGRPGRKFVDLVQTVPVSCQEDDKLMCLDQQLPRFEDFLSGPVPSAIPSPELRPSQNTPDLMHFEQIDNGDKVWEISEEDQRGLHSPLCRTPTSELLHLAASNLPTAPMPEPLLSLFPANIPLTSIFSPSAPSANTESNTTQLPQTSDISGSACSEMPHVTASAACHASNKPTIQSDNMGTDSSAPVSAFEQLIQHGRWWESSQEQIPWAGPSQDPNDAKTILASNTQVQMPTSEGHAKDNAEVDKSVITSVPTDAGSTDRSACPSTQERSSKVQDGSADQSVPDLGEDQQSPGRGKLKRLLSSDIVGDRERAGNTSIPSSCQEYANPAPSSDDGIDERDPEQVLAALSLSEKKTAVCKENKVTEESNKGAVPDDDCTLYESSVDVCFTSAGKIPKVTITDTHAAGDASASQKNSEAPIKNVSQLCQRLFAGEVPAAGAGDAPPMSVKFENVQVEVDGGNTKAGKGSLEVLQNGDVEGTDVATPLQALLSADDSFSLGQPLDTSSTLSDENLDTISPHKSPRKTPRRARLAAKFLNPIDS